MACLGCLRRTLRLFSFPLSRLSSSSLARETLSDDTREIILKHAEKKQTGVSLKFMLDFGQNPIDRQLLLSAQFLHRELPVRLAHRIVELENLPYGLGANKQILTVQKWYVDSLMDLIELPKPKNFEDDNCFTEVLRKIYKRHEFVVPVMARGINELKRELSSEVGLTELPDIHQFLDGFYMSRIGIRFLIGQHISLHTPPEEHFIGLIHQKCSPVRVCRDAITNASDVCNCLFGLSPKVDVYGKEDFTFAYVPSHIHYMVFELMKNSLRAVQDRYADKPVPTPNIRLVVAEGAEDVTIKVSDEGGGIPRRDLPRIWTYLYSTAKSPLPEVDDQGQNAPTVLAGYGYGLPISRLYARYFGGELQVMPLVSCFILIDSAGCDLDYFNGGIWNGCLFAFESIGKRPGASALKLTPRESELTGSRLRLPGSKSMKLP